MNPLRVFIARFVVGFVVSAVAHDALGFGRKRVHLLLKGANEREFELHFRAYNQTCGGTPVVADKVSAVQTHDGVFKRGE
jgi:hypothetical protein